MSIQIIGLIVLFFVAWKVANAILKRNTAKKAENGEVEGTLNEKPKMKINVQQLVDIDESIKQIRRVLKEHPLDGGMEWVVGTFGTYVVEIKIKYTNKDTGVKESTDKKYLEVCLNNEWGLKVKYYKGELKAIAVEIQRLLKETQGVELGIINRE